MTDEFQSETLKKLTRLETMLEPLVSKVERQGERIEKVERHQFRLAVVCTGVLTVLAAAGQGIGHVVKAAIAAIASQG